MAGFRSLARQVRDPQCDLALRRYSLRKCLERFAPYGHRATWDHLCSRAGMDPEDRSCDPADLVAALDELEERLAAVPHGRPQHKRVGVLLYRHDARRTTNGQLHVASPVRERGFVRERRLSCCCVCCHGVLSLLRVLFPLTSALRGLLLDGYCLPFCAILRLVGRSNCQRREG